MAYAAIAGLPIQYGIYASAVACLLGPLFAGSRFITLGPTNASSVLLFTAFLAMGVTEEEKLLMLPLLLVMVSLILVLGSIIKVASLIQFISRSVVTGYITAAAFYIITNQIRKAIGVEFEIPKGTTFFGVIRLTAENLSQAHNPTVLLSILTATIFIILNKKFKTLPNVAITLLIVSLIAFGINHTNENPVQWAMLNSIDAASWSITLPPFNYQWISQLASTALIIAFLSVLEGSSIGKSLAAQSGERIDVNQEMFAMGIANLGCALYGGMPASGSLTRSQLNWSSGSRTCISNIICGLFCAIGAYTLGPYIGYIPVASLAVLVIAIGCSLINKHVIKVIIRTTNSDALVFATTFISALLIRLDIAIILGTATSIMLFLQKAAKPALTEYSFNRKGELTEMNKTSERPDPEVSIVHVEGDLFFGAAELFRDQIRRVCEDPNLKIVILKVRNARHIDATAILALEELIRYMNEHDRVLIISEVRKPILRVFRDSGLIHFINKKNLFIDHPQNTTLSTARALKRSQQILGDKQARVSIYTSRN